MLFSYFLGREKYLKQTENLSLSESTETFNIARPSEFEFELSFFNVTGFQQRFYFNFKRQLYTELSETSI